MHIHKMSVIAIKKIAEPGYHSDGGNLFVQVTGPHTKSWVFRYQRNGKKREMGLGSLATVTPVIARERAAQYRLQLHDGLDPMAERKRIIAARKATPAAVLTFEQCAVQCIKDRSAAFSCAKHTAQWGATLGSYAYPHIGSLSVADVTTAGVRKCIDPIWATKTETATRVRQRIEAVLDWAKAHGHRTGDNPAAWKGHLQGVMAAPRKLTKVVHHPALSIDALPEFMATLGTHNGVAAQALQLLILTACRTSEVTNATWLEVDLDAKVWTIPAERMKAKIAHTVPLSAPAVALLKRARSYAATSPWVFPGQRKGACISNMAMLELVKGMARVDDKGEPITVHGFRSTFRQWAAEQSDHSREVAEHALAHRLTDKTEAAYQRSTLVDKRRLLMADWAAFAVQ